MPIVVSNNMLVNCNNCNKEFNKKPSQIKKYKTHYCSLSCANLGFKGEHFSRNSEFSKGMTPWNKGIKTGYAPWLGKKRPNMTEERAHQWKGDKVGYHGLHDWVYKHLGAPDICEHCGKSELKGRQIHWANKSQEYKRDLNDWLRLCASCHKIYDANFYKNKFSMI